MSNQRPNVQLVTFLNDTPFINCLLCNLQVSLGFSIPAKVTIGWGKRNSKEEEIVVQDGIRFSSCQMKNYPITKEGRVCATCSAKKGVEIKRDKPTHYGTVKSLRGW